MRRKAFTLLELLVVIGIIGILVTILAPQLGKMMAKAKRTKCLTNLRALSTGVGAYKADNGDRTPVMRRSPAVDADVNSAPDSTTGENVEYGSGEDGDDWDALGDQAMQNVWLMIQSGDVKDNVFHCPADGEWEKRESDFNFGWTSPYQYSYGVQWPYAYAADGTTRNTAPFSSDLDGSVTAFADMCPDLNATDTVGVDFDGGIEAMHGKLGFNFLAGDTPQEYDDKDNSNAGYAGDDIYTGSAVGIAGAMPEAEGEPDPDAPPSTYDAKRDSSIALSGRTFVAEP